MPELELHELEAGASGEELKLSLWRKPNPGRTPVLLLHGASANHRTFSKPGPDPQTGAPRCLMDWLHAGGFEPWLLDWRGNGRIDRGELHRLRDRLDFDNAAKYDIPRALARIRETSRPTRICAVGHCMGAATLAQAIAAGHVGQEQGLTHVVLLAIGLFYEPAWDGRLKSQDHVLERLSLPPSREVAIDPRLHLHSGWPAELEEVYRNWPTSLRPHPVPRSRMDEICNRVSFMFGPPYRERNLLPGVHQGSFLEDQFGAIPLRMYLHGAQNIRRGWAARFDATNDDDELVGEDALERFWSLESVTLLTGARNQIWHRESIDRMHEWLSSGPAWRSVGIHREILADYAHQDLLWGKQAFVEVFPKILDGLQRRRVEIRRVGRPRVASDAQRPTG